MEFELSFRNKIVRMFFIWVIPVWLLTIILIFTLPNHYQWIPSFLPIVTVIIFYLWAKFYSKTEKS
ncbi:hypothetical protein CEH05_08125 [Halobacillus halophilus]|nr:hypothetical protein CEH05_08125 [Halobacillus halophilus]